MDSPNLGAGRNKGTVCDTRTANTENLGRPGRGLAAHARGRFCTVTHEAASQTWNAAA
ncbi:hypothetical protein [Gordonia rhizosphera]|uniref:Uncharacterized protein n=1 Tax=Gordonia rhizosphera NBRC 16068 TaxID=1108045 RepID=K6WF52_9ACTN|nr:hypothetical protein [Gordonia rhizosphera]GAB92371.1 hypothetical protein GORHZ_171_00440 [Gordonia rhizosphera NBRC 16068]